MPIVSGTHYVYTVRANDTVYSIASRFGSKVALIEQANALYPPFTDPGLIFPGQVLVVPSVQLDQRTEVYYVVKPGDTFYSIAGKFNSGVDLLAGINPQIANPNFIYTHQMIRIPVFIYEISAGDSLYHLSRRMGIPLSILLRANTGRPGLSPDVIYPGYRLIIPLPSSQNIVVIQPLPGSEFREGSVIEGFARAFEATVQYQIRDENGNVVAAERTMQASEGGPAFGYFSAVMQFDRQPTTTVGELWVYTRSAEDGSIRDLVQVRGFF